MMPEYKSIYDKIKYLSKTDFINYIKEAPLTETEKKLLSDIREGLNLKTLSEKFKITVSGITKWKTRIYKKLFIWEQNIVEQPSTKTTEKINIENLISNKTTTIFEKTEELLDELLDRKEKELLKQRLDILKKNSLLNTRGTKRSLPVTMFTETNSSDKKISMISKEDLKKKYIPMYSRGEITSKEVCHILGITPQYLSKLKKNYLCEGLNSLNNKRKGNIPTNKTSEELKDKIYTLYKNNFYFMSFSEFCTILKEKYNIKLSYPTLRNILLEKGLKSPTTDKFSGKHEESIGKEYFEIIKFIEDGIATIEINTLEEFGLIQLCELAFNKAYITLNNIAKQKYKMKFKTSYSLFSFFVEKKLIPIEDEFKYWNKHNEYFYYTYDIINRTRVINDINNIYINMFIKIKQYILNN